MTKIWSLNRATFNAEHFDIIILKNNDYVFITHTKIDVPMFTIYLNIVKFFICVSSFSFLHNEIMTS